MKYVIVLPDGVSDVPIKALGEKTPLEVAKHPNIDWVEREGITGWSIGPKPLESSLTSTNDTVDAEDLYNKLENIIIPMYYHDRSQWIKIMKNSIGKIAYYFNSHRMMRRYVTEAYLR